MAKWNGKQLQGFADAVQSLKLYRRAELVDENTDRPLIEELYVDPLPDNAVLQTMLRSSTTFLIGRKGTGKSTVFQRAQHELRKRANAISAYIDIKTVFESAEVDPALVQKIASTENALPEDDVKRLLLYRAFIREVLSEVKVEIRKKIDASPVEKIKSIFGKSKAEVFESLDELLSAPFDSSFTDVTGLKSVSRNERDASKKETQTKTEAEGSVAIAPTGGKFGGKFSRERMNAHSAEASSEEIYSKILMRHLNIVGIMDQIGHILKSIGIRNLFIFIDDFSELPIGAMTVFVDTVLAPLNNWSNELVKFKVAAYPGRVYYGQIDTTKIDEVFLDLFKLYGANDVNTMEDKAIDFTKRLINNRLQYYCGIGFDAFAVGDIDFVYRHLFYATLGNPRNLGHILHYLRESHLVYDDGIGVRAVRDAASKYYEEKIEPYFGVQKFRQESFSERSSVFSLKELLETVVARARELRAHKGSAVFESLRELRGLPPTSHFHVVTELEGLLSTLELNFFLTKYFEMKDRDGRKVSVFALNYGLCNKYSIEFGKPEGKREFRLYFVERIFDYTPLLKSYLNRNQEIKCENCGAVFGVDQLESLKLYGMTCPRCRDGSCAIVNLSRKYEKVLEEISEELLLPATELGILETLFSERRDLAAAEIAAELDCSYQLIGKRGKIMEERGLVLRRMELQRRKFRITKLAVEEYFAGNESRKLDIKEDE